MIKKITLLLFIPFALQAQEDDLITKTGSFDYEVAGRTYLYEGAYVISKESGSKVKLPHGKGKLMQPENMEVEKMSKKGYSLTPYLYDGEWKLGVKHGKGLERIFRLKDGETFEPAKLWSYFIVEYEGFYSEGLYDGKGTHKTLDFEYTGDFKAGKRHGEGSIQFVKQPSPPTDERMKQIKVKEKYEGGWEEDMYHGKGTFISFWRNISFTGEFDRNLLAKLNLSSSGANDMEFLGSLTMHIERLFKQGNYTFDDGNTYDGEWKIGLPSGKGTYTWKKTGDVYIGEFENGQPKGQGKLTQKNGSYFEGIFQDGNCTGKGKMNITSKFYNSQAKPREISGIYEGEITDNMPNGNGIFITKKLVSYIEYNDNGDEIIKEYPEYCYTGSWERGQKNGAGKFEAYIDSEYGVESYSYEGDYKNDLYNGENGTLKEFYPFGSTSYIGGFKSGLFHGVGKYTSYSEGIGESYEGEFVKGKFEGEGIYEEETGMGRIIKKGTFQNNNIITGITEYYQDAEKPITVYNGTYQNGVENGMGKVEYFDVFEEFSVDWSNNKVKSYDGEWANGFPNGQGTMVYKNGTKQTGRFRDGEYIKPFSAPSVKIGNQNWMSENLTVTRFRNGDPIPEAKTKEEWLTSARQGKPAFCYYNNDPSTAKKYGVIYNFYAVTDDRNLAPEGWYVPSHQDIDILTNFVNSNMIDDMNAITLKRKEGINTKALESQYKKKYSVLDNIGINKLKTSSKAWKNPGNNTLGFNASPSMQRWGFDSGSYYSEYEGIFYEKGDDAIYWTTSYYKSGEGSAFVIKGVFYPELSQSYGMGTIAEPKSYGYPVRLLKVD